jgi:hypothetical protein
MNDNPAAQISNNNYRISDNPPSSFNELRLRKTMHHQIPLNPFKATIKLHPRSRLSHPLIGPSDPFISNPTSSLTAGSYITDEQAVLSSGYSEAYLEQCSIVNETDTPASFPPTPFSRAYIMNRSAERVNTVMFSARDKLRQEAQSISTDYHSSRIAKEAKMSGHLAVFDMKKSAEQIVLSCGNHCIMKVGNGICANSLCMVPLQTNVHVYYEFSITVSNHQIPSIVLGFAPDDCPRNMMIGSWPYGLGINTDGHLLIGSYWIPPLTPMTILPGSTVGFLIYLPSFPLHDNKNKSNNIVLEIDQTDKDPIPLSNKHLINQDKVQLDFHHQTMMMDDNQTTLVNETVSNCQREKHFSICINVDGIVIQYSENEYFSALAEEMKSNHKALYPAVSLLSENTRVWCRFCEADIVYREPQLIGVKPHTRVYCADGSILLHGDAVGY